MNYGLLRHNKKGEQLLSLISNYMAESLLFLTVVGYGLGLFAFVGNS